MIIYGTKVFKKILGYLGEHRVCTRCHRNVRFNILRTWTWGTLFWIPLLPLFKKYYLICPECEAAYKIKKKEAKELTK